MEGLITEQEAIIARKFGISQDAEFYYKNGYLYPKHYANALIMGDSVYRTGWTAAHLKIQKKMIIATKSKLKGFDAAIEVRGSIFNLRNVYEEGTGFTHIDISDDKGKFLDEFASGFGVDPKDAEDDAEQFELNSIRVFEYIDENLVF